MILWTIQNEKVLEEIERYGTYTCDGTHSFALDPDGTEDACIRIAYDWISQELEKKSIRPTKRKIDPIWAWAKYYNRNDGKPDMRSWLTNTPEKVVRLKLDIPNSRLLLSGFDAWHFPLNNWYLSSSAEDLERFDKRLDNLNAVLLHNEETDVYIGQFAINELLSGKFSPAAIINKFSTISEQRVDKMWKTYFECGNINAISSIFSLNIDDIVSLYDKALLLLVRLAVEVRESWKRCLLNVHDNDEIVGWQEQYRIMNSLNENIDFDKMSAWNEFEVQAIFWELRSDDIVNVEHFVTRQAKKY